jgi:hypothetical protein
MSKTVPQLGKTVPHLISTAAKVGVHETPQKTKFLVSVSVLTTSLKTA